MGNIRPSNNERRDEEAADHVITDYHSTVCLPSKIPNPELDYYTPYGAKLPQGNLIRNPAFDDSRSWYTSYHECVVFNSKQIKMRYLVMTEWNVLSLW